MAVPEFPQSVHLSVDIPSRPAIDADFISLYFNLHLDFAHIVGLFGDLLLVRSCI